ncbi:MAG: hypothetical protein JNL97_09010, partial [Verrucomicrobiales bacterium]|nr:hypothetical protein [Verrucomicrobiales bacterium]
MGSPSAFDGRSRGGQPDEFDRRLFRGYARVGAAVSMALCLLEPASATEVIGYSVIKGHFLEQRGPEELVLDSFFGFS